MLKWFLSLFKKKQVKDMTKCSMPDCQNKPWPYCREHDWP